MNNLLKILILILGFGTFNIAQAARPMMTDDARIVVLIFSTLKNLSLSHSKLNQFNKWL